MAARELAETAAWAVREMLEAVGDEAKVRIISCQNIYILSWTDGTC